MRRATVAEKLVLAAIVLPGTAMVAFVLGCGGSERRVSPWGGAERPSLAPYIAPSNLEAQLATIDAETAELGLVLVREVRGKLPAGGGAFVVRSYRGRDALGRPTHAVRAATGRGVVMAVGPLEASEPRDKATELVEALVPAEDGEGGAFQSGTDLNGDGYPDVVLRNEIGVMEVWRLAPMGASLYSMDLEVSPIHAFDANEDGRIDFGGADAAPPSDPIGPRFEDVAVFDGFGYTNRAPGARAWHADRASALVPLKAADEIRLSRALELAWHRILSGAPRADVLKKLDAEPVPAALRASFNRHRARIERLRRQSESAAPK